MRDADLAGLQAVLVNNVLLRGKHEPNGFVVHGAVFFVRVAIVVADKSLLGRRLFLLLLRRLDVFQQRRRSASDL